MSGSLLTAVLAGVGGMLGWGLSDFLAKKTFDRVSEVTRLFWSQLAGLVPLLGLFAVVRTVPTVHHMDALWLALFGIVIALAHLALYVGFAKGSISFLSPVFSSQAILIVVLSALVFGEHITGPQWAAIIVVIVGVLAISTTLPELAQVVRGSRGRMTRGLPHVLVAAVAFAFWDVALNRFLGVRDWLFFLIMIRVAAAFTIGVYAIVTNASLALPRRAPALAAWVSLVGLTDAAAFGAVTYGFSATTHTSIVAVISAAFSVPTLVLARVFLRERLATQQKIAAGIIVCGIALVSVH